MRNPRDGRSRGPTFIGDTLTVAMEMTGKRPTSRADIELVERLNQASTMVQTGISNMETARRPES